MSRFSNLYLHLEVIAFDNNIGIMYGTIVHTAVDNTVVWVSTEGRAVNQTERILVSRVRERHTGLPLHDYSCASQAMINELRTEREQARAGLVPDKFDSPLNVVSDASLAWGGVARDTSVPIPQAPAVAGVTVQISGCVIQALPEIKRGRRGSVQVKFGVMAATTRFIPIEFVYPLITNEFEGVVSAADAQSVLLLRGVYVVDIERDLLWVMVRWISTESGVDSLWRASVALIHFQDAPPTDVSAIEASQVRIRAREKKEQIKAVRTDSVSVWTCQPRCLNRSPTAMSVTRQYWLIPVHRLVGKANVKTGLRWVTTMRECIRKSFLSVAVRIFPSARRALGSKERLEGTGVSWLLVATTMLLRLVELTCSNTVNVSLSVCFEPSAAFGRLSASFTASSVSAADQDDSTRPSEKGAVRDIIVISSDHDGPATDTPVSRPVTLASGSSRQSTAYFPVQPRRKQCVHLDRRLRTPACAAPLVGLAGSSALGFHPRLHRPEVIPMALPSRVRQPGSTRYSSGERKIRSQPLRVEDFTNVACVGISSLIPSHFNVGMVPVIRAFASPSSIDGNVLNVVLLWCRRLSGSIQKNRQLAVYTESGTILW
ncbi:hypothetical protein K438DRAFT_1984568 [Mycena galopus ATCC 62051]|nr:hypothetical protein K438DRAFT_1984568 [Mycena galopus ATCC 62051]